MVERLEIKAALAVECKCENGTEQAVRHAEVVYGRVMKRRHATCIHINGAPFANACAIQPKLVTAQRC